MTIPYKRSELFEINDSVEIEEKSIGSYKYWSINNFYKRPEEIYKMFEQSWFLNWKINNQSKNFEDYYDCRTEISMDPAVFHDQKSNDFFKELFNNSNLKCNILATHAFTWLNTPSNNIQFPPHYDNSYNILVYMDKINSGGTAFYEGEISRAIDYESTNMQFDVKGYTKNIIPSEFNKCVIFDGNILHAGYIEDHQKYSKGKWRYNTVYFFQWLSS